MSCGNTEYNGPDGKRKGGCTVLLVSSPLVVLPHVYFSGQCPYFFIWTMLNVPHNVELH